MALVFDNTTGYVSIEADNGGSAAVAPASKGRLRYNALTSSWEMSANGGAWEVIADSLNAAGWSYNAGSGLVYVTDNSDDVVIGNSTVTGTEKLYVLGDADEQVARLEFAGDVTGGLSGVAMLLRPDSIGAAANWIGLNVQGGCSGASAGNCTTMYIDGTVEGATSGGYQCSTLMLEVGGIDSNNAKTGLYISQPATVDGNPSVVNDMVRLHYQGGTLGAFIQLIGELPSHTAMDFGAASMEGDACKIFGTDGDVVFGSTFMSGTEKLRVVSDNNVGTVALFEFGGAFTGGNLSSTKFDHRATSIGPGYDWTAVELIGGTDGAAYSDSSTVLKIDATHSTSTIGAGTDMYGLYMDIGKGAANGTMYALDIVLPATVGAHASHLDTFLLLDRQGGTLGKFIDLQGGASTHVGLDFGLTYIEGNDCAIFGSGGTAVFGATAMASTETLRVVGDSLFGGETLVKSHASYAGSGSFTETFGWHTTEDTNWAAVEITLDDEYVYQFQSEVVARCTDDATVRAAYRRSCMVYREGGGATIGAAGVQDDFTDETDAGLASSLAVNANDFRVTVQGLVGKTIDWHITLRWSRVHSNA